MSFAYDGPDAKIKSITISTNILAKDPLILLGNAIDWCHLQQLVINDLKSTTAKGFWNLGRKLILRPHLAVMTLQLILKATDRGIEEMVKQTPIYQAYCGYGIIPGWKCPDHTKIEEFRSRLSSETHKSIGDYVIKLAIKLGFACHSEVDIDSTAQEANIAYPSDASLMKKLALKCQHVLGFLKEKGKSYLPKCLEIDIKKIIKKSREYFFLAKNTAIEKKREIFASYHSLVKSELKEFIKFAEEITPQALSRLPWNYREALMQIKEHGRRYLLDVAHFVRTHTLKEGKILSFNMKDVVCITKGKPGKDREFGRVWQLGRIKGNFLVAYLSTSLRMNDKQSLGAILKEHEQHFGKEVLSTITADKGYYTHENIDLAKKYSGNSEGIQRPGNIKNYVAGLRTEELYNRRSGVEPLIGHAKKFGLGKSKMKSDTATLSGGYRSVLGFNLHQLKRSLSGLVA
ncbi:MAG: transposase [Bacteriovoracaceae bacterium]|nr:transposase [Bacteriovoracaceae bacterium]